MAKTINLGFEGYWREVSKSCVPSDSGVCTVYVCKYNPPPKDTVTLERIVYFGEAQDVNDRISKHEKWEEWREEVGTRQESCFNFAKVTNPDRERAECALIYYHKPKCDDECRYSFPYEDTTIISTGKHALIESLITVRSIRGSAGWYEGRKAQEKEEMRYTSLSQGQSPGCLANCGLYPRQSIEGSNRVPKAVT